MKKQKGFSLIELLIVVAIILIIAAIAIPNLIRARISANESSAAAATRTIATADIQYQTSYKSYASALSNLAGPSTGCGTGVPASTAACLIDYALGFAVAASPKSGYVYVAGADSTGQAFTEGATAAVPGRSGNKTFCAIEDGVVRYDTTSNAAATTTSATCVALQPIGN